MNHVMRSPLRGWFLLAASLALASCSANDRRGAAADSSRPLTISVEFYRLAGGVPSSGPACRIEPDSKAIVVEGREIPAGQMAEGIERLAAPRVTCLPEQPAQIEIGSEPEPGRPARGIRLSMNGRHQEGGSILLSSFAAEITERSLAASGESVERTRRTELSFSLPASHHAVITLPASAPDEAVIALVVRAS
jgi:hypothetical protein